MKDSRRQVPMTVPPTTIREGASQFHGAFLAVALLVLAVYVMTLAPDLTGGDSGELICAAAELGVAHPPGYPLWTMLGHVFSWIPVGSLAWRLNLFSAICAAAAAGVLGRVIQLWTGHVWAGVCGAGLFAFSPLVWEYARQAEVFALNNLLLALVLLTATRFAERASVRNTFAAAVVWGLAGAHHHTAVFLVAPVAAWIFVHLLRNPAIRRRGLLAALTGAALGFLPYVYLPLATRFSSGWAWGDTDSWSGFFAHFLRRDFGTFQLSAGTGTQHVSLALLLRAYFGHAFAGLTVVGLPLAVFGAFALLKRTAGLPFRSVAGVVAGGLAAYLILFQALINLSPTDPLLGRVVARFWMLPDLLLALFAGVGFAAVSRVRAWPERATALTALACCGLAIIWQHRRMPVDGNYTASYARAILDPLPPGALLLVRGDLPSNGIRYVQTAEKFRRDVVVLDLELLTREWYVRRMQARHPAIRFPGRLYHPDVADGFSLAGLVEANRPATSVWLYPEFKPGDPSVAAFSLWPRGFAQEIRGKGEPPPADLTAWMRSNEAALAKLRERFASASSRRPGTWDRITADDTWLATHRYAFSVLQLAWAQAPSTSSGPGAPAEADLLLEAQRLYEEFVAQCPHPLFHAWKNLGLVYSRRLGQDPTLAPKLSSAWQRYLELAPADDPDRAAITEYLKQLSAPGMR